MNNLFYNISLLSKLCNILDELTDEDDRISISVIIRKIMPKESKYVNNLSNITTREASHQASGIRKCKVFAVEYIHSLYKIDVFQRCEQPEYLFDLMSDLDYDKWNNIINKMTEDFQIARAHIFKTVLDDNRNDIINSFDLYVTNIFIEKYIEIKNSINEN